MSNFSTKKANVEQQPTPVEFVRDTSDNKLFKNIQVKDLSTVTDENTRWKADSDGIVWKACASQETLFITVTHKIVKTVTEELQGVREFKGLGNKISETSWLGVENIKRIAKGDEPWTVDDFEVVSGSRLNLTEDKAFEQAKIIVLTKLKSLRQQFNIKNIDVCIGSGDCFRHSLDLIKPYKGERSPYRPILLKKVREWVLNDLKGEEAPKGFENDDYCEWWGFKGYQDYKKTGIFSYGVIAEDKDAQSNAKLLINFGVRSGKDNPKKGQFKYPQAWLIPDASVSVGELDLVTNGVKKDVKGTGLIWLVIQSFLTGDSADGYKALQHLPEHHKVTYGDVSAYKDLLGLKTPTEVLQKVVDLYAEFLPYGVQYTSHKGIEMDVPTLEYMNTYMKVAYMTRSQNDTLDFYRLCKAFKVDTSKIEDNNKLTPPKKVFNPDSESKVIKNNETLLQLLTEELNSYKSLKKNELVDKLDIIKGCLSSLTETFDEFYEMKQEEK